jgi:hypothetical protein
VAFLLVLPHPLYNQRTYFSENALLPGLVTAEFSEERAAKRYVKGSVPDPDPHVFGPPGSVSICQRYGSGSGSFRHHAKIVRKTLIPTIL